MAHKIENRHFTRTGRIVYNRKVHLWGLRDLQRVSRAVEVSPSDWDWLVAIIHEIEDRMLEAAFKAFGAAELAKRARDFVEGFIARLIDKLGGALSIDVKFYINGEEIAREEPKI